MSIDQETIWRNLQDFKDLCFAGTNNVYLGSTDSIPKGTVSPSDWSGFFHMMTNDTDPNASAYSSMVDATKTSQIQVRTNTTTSVYSGYNASALTDAFRATAIDAFIPLEYIRDINCKNFLKGLYAWYSVTKQISRTDNNWNKFINGANITVYIPPETGSSMNAITVNLKNPTPDARTLLQYMNQIVNLTDVVMNPAFNLYGWNRLVYLYICIHQCKLSTAIYTLKNVEGNDYNNWANLFRDLIDENMTVLQDGASTELSTQLNQYSGSYTLKSNVINAIGDEVLESQKVLRTNEERVNVEAENEKKTRIFEYVSLAILFLVSAGTIAVLQLPLDPMNRIKIGGAVLILAAIFALIVNMVFSKVVVENFTDQQVIEGFYDITAFNSSTSIGLLDNVNEYITKLKTLIQTVNSYRALRNVDYAMSKELDYYMGVTQQMNQNIAKLKSVHRLSDYQQRVIAIRMNMYLILALTMAATVLALTVAEKMGKAETARRPIFVVAGVVIFMAMVIFLLEMSSIVRTDGDKLYWKQPNMSYYNASS